MNAILSLFLSIAMLFTGGALPAALDTASTFTVQDVVVGYNDEAYPLGFNVSLTAAASQDEVLLHFEAVNEEGEVLLPLSGKMTADGVTFALSDEGSAFTLSAETVGAMLGMEEDDVSYLEELAAEIASYAGAASSLENSRLAGITAEQRAVMMNVLYANMQGMVSEETQWDFGNGDIPATHVNGVLGVSDLFATMDGWLNMNDDAVAPAMSGVLDLYNAVFSMGGVSVLENVPQLGDAASIGVIGGADGPTAVYVAGEEGAYAPAESFGELLEKMIAANPDMGAELEQIAVEMDIISAMEDDTEYQSVNLYMDMGEELGGVLNFNGESAVHPEKSTVYFGLYLEEGSTGVSYEAQLDVEGPMENPLASNLEMMVQTNNTLDYTDYEEASSEEILYTTETVFANVNSIYEDGLEDADISIELRESSMLYVDGEFSEGEEGEAIFISVITDEEVDEDGSLLCTYDISVETPDGENMTLAFNTALSSVPVQDYFSALAAVELPADGADPAYETLSGDFIGLMEDLMTLGSDEGLVSILGLFNGEYEADAGDDYSDDEYSDDDYYDDDYSDDEYYDDEYSDDDYSDDEYYDDEYSDDEYFESEYEEDYQLSSMEEAAEVFAGEIVSFTAPEGFELEEVLVTADGNYLNANYYSEDGRYIAINQDCYDATSEMDYFVAGDGTVSLAEGAIACVYKTEAGYYYAQFYLSSGSLSIYFDECGMEEVQNILSGLQL